ncbi:MAG TPA: hypothetical protein PKA23_13365, partial [Accumulibacter sp.]|nr:hypothetical protein [Accumulibacter sp.]
MLRTAAPLCLALAIFGAVPSWPLSVDAASEPSAPRKTLRAFDDEQQLAGLFKRWADEAQRRRDDAQQARLKKVEGAAPSTQALPLPAPTPAP